MEFTVKTEGAYLEDKYVHYELVGNPVVESYSFDPSSQKYTFKLSGTRTESTELR